MVYCLELPWNTPMKLSDSPSFIPLGRDDSYSTNTDTYYPPGTVCANDKFKQFCPTSGESGFKKLK